MTRLILAPHADDEVLGCEGLLAKYPNECVVAVCSIPSLVRRDEVVEKARRILSDRNYGLAGVARVLVLGVAYKPEVEDLRESPALEIIAAMTANVTKL